MNLVPDNDKVNCPTNYTTHKIKYITLKSPNVAIDEDGFYGTWTFAYTQAIQIQIAGLDIMMYFNYSYNDTEKQIVITDCKKTIANMGWVKLQGVSRPAHGCAKGQNIAPVLDKTTNVRNKSAPGPVNFIEVDGR